MNLIKSLALNTTASLVITVGGLTGVAHAAGNASLSMSGSTHNVGTSFAVPIYVNSADPLNVVQADFSYNASQLQFQGASCGGAFGITADSGANSVTCGVSSGGSVTGSQLVAIVNFKALAGSGSSIISIASSSHVWSATDNSDIWNGVPNSAGISFTTPVPVAPAVTTPTPTPTTPQKKAAVVKHATVSTQPAKGHLSAWVYGPVGLVAAVAGIAYVFRKEVAKLTKGTRKSFKSAVRNLRKNSPLKTSQRS